VRTVHPSASAVELRSDVATSSWPTSRFRSLSTQPNCKATKGRVV